MFGFLKDKLKKALGKFSKEVEEEVIVEKPAIKKEIKEPEPKKVEKVEEKATEEKRGFFKKIFKKEKAEEVKEAKPEKKEEAKAIEKPPEKPKEKPKEVKEEKIAELKEEAEEKIKIEFKKEKEELKEEKKKPEEKKVEKEEAEEKRGFLKRFAEGFTKFNLSEEKFEKLFWELEVVLMESNVAIEVIDKIKHDLKQELTKDKISRKNVEETIKETLKESIQGLFEIQTIDLLKEVRRKKPYVIAMIGVNGSGKTTTLAKLTYLMQKNGLSVVWAASDTFRAAAIQQLEEHANRLGVKMIKHDYHSDPAAVAFDAIEHAKAKDIDVVFIDTAGRLHSNTNLMDELKKLIRVNKPDFKLFVGEAITGNDCVEQAKEYNNMVGIDGIILAKADVDDKGGAAISISYVLKKPILYLGTGQRYEDLKVFEPQLVINSLGL
jgi:fused signal recognition particle receptor